jgi:iron complex outermembrane receptor protein
LKTRLIPAAVSVGLALAAAANAEAMETEPLEDAEGIEIVIVTGVRLDDTLVLESSQVSQTGLDNSDLLRMFPGGNRNANGPLTRISQYRGLFGAQNNVLIDGAVYGADCPNWMDTPLSSIPQSLTGSVTLHRGLGSIDTIQEGLGGGIEIRSRRGEFAEDSTWSSYGDAQIGYGSNASAWNGALLAGFSNHRNRIDFAASFDRGDDYQFDGGTVAATEYDRAQYRFDYSHRFREAELGVGMVVNRTGASGTPALPMDMRFVDSEQYAFELDIPAGNGRLSVQGSTLSVDHVMDNFTLRPPPLNPMGKPRYRESAPLGDLDSMKLAWLVSTDRVQWQFGLDGRWESHGQDITDPTNDRFIIVNFNDVKRDRTGLFASAGWPAGSWDLEVGLRYNRVKMSAGEVGGDLAINMMSPMYIQQERLDELADAFNAADRDKTDDQWSGVLKASRQLGDEVRLNLGLGRKVRSPSYQERYLWLPSEATAGLADGRVYIGDISLTPEQSLEFTVGIDWTAGRFKLTPELFYRDISNFIQGVPSTNETANKFSMMMTGKPPLQYANVEAEQYGLDMGYEWRISDVWLLRGSLSYVRGKRTDVRDNLYRIAPLSSFAELMYYRERWFLSAESVAAARQDKVAAFNQEQETPGWGIVNLRAGMQLNTIFNLGLGVENLFDKVYQDHLGGYNRVRESDIPVGARLNSIGRNFYLKLNATW